MSRNKLGIDRQLGLGLGFVALLVLVVFGTIASYRGTFTDSVPVTVEADRAGQTLATGAVVKLRGVEVGTVEEVRTAGDGVQIRLALDKDQVGRIPVDVTVQIVPPTAFGAKYVQFTDPGSGTADRLRDDSVIPADRVTVEVDEAFESLTKVLDVARPAQVSGALTALADTVDTRGQRIGELVERTDGYLARLNPSLAALAEDLRAADDVAATYDAARPDLVTLLTSLAVTGETLDTQQAGLRDLSVSLRKFSNEADALLRESGAGLEKALFTLAPVSQLLSKYSPELPCTILGLSGANKLAEVAVGGTHPGVTTLTRVVPGRDPYSFESDLPQIGDTRGPLCHGLPYVTEEEALMTPPALETGANPHSGPQSAPVERTTTTLLNLLIGGGNLL